MGIRTTIPPGATPLAAVDAIMAMYGRENVELAIETLIARLDAIDGDPDLEDDTEDCCPAGDDAPVASHLGLRLGEHEDDEDDDPDHCALDMAEGDDGPDDETYAALVTRGGWAAAAERERAGREFGRGGR